MVMRRLEYGAAWLLVATVAVVAVSVVGVTLTRSSVTATSPAEGMPASASRANLGSAAVHSHACVRRAAPSYVSHSTAAALKDLYHACNGATWTSHSNWLVGDPCVDFWHGVNCTDGAITSLYVSQCESDSRHSRSPRLLNAQYPLTARCLSRVLPNNAIAGTIPSSFGDLVNLEKMYGDTCQPSNQLPACCDRS